MCHFLVTKAVYYFTWIEYLQTSLGKTNWRLNTECHNHNRFSTIDCINCIALLSLGIINFDLGMTPYDSSAKNFSIVSLSAAFDVLRTRQTFWYLSLVWRLPYRFEIFPTTVHPKRVSFATGAKSRVDLLVIMISTASSTSWPINTPTSPGLDDWHI